MTPDQFLRPYQRTAIDNLRAKIRAGQKRLVLYAPTGGGKTATFAAMCWGAVQKGGTAVVFEHRDELVRQAVAALERFDLSVGYNGLRPSAPVQVLTVQTALARGQVPPATLVVPDEAHHYVADEWSSVLKAYESAVIIGPTATPMRHDGRPMKPPFEDVVVMAQIGELITMGHLVPCDVFAPEDPITQGEAMALSPVEAYVQYAHGTSAIVFAPHVQAAGDFAREFEAKGITCGVVHGKMSQEDRRTVLDAHDAGRISVLCNVYVLTEGYDSPRVKTCILARRIGSPGAYLQMVGRVLRPFLRDGRERARLIDLYGTSVQAHGRPEDERIFSLDGKAIRLAKGESFCRVHGTPTPCELCEREISEQLTPGSLGIQLAQWKEQIRKDDDEQRIQRLAKWLMLCRVKGYKQGYAFGKYKGTYGQFPSRGIVEQATAMSWKGAGAA